MGPEPCRWAPGLPTYGILVPMARGSSFQVFFTGPTTLGDAAQALSRTMHVTTDSAAGNTGLQVRRAEGAEPALEVGLSTEPNIAVEARQIAEYRKIEEFTAFDRRFEVYIDDLEQTLAEAETMAADQRTLQELTGGYAVQSWSGAIHQP
jgi:hypothetical protein